MLFQPGGEMIEIKREKRWKLTRSEELKGQKSRSKKHRNGETIMKFGTIRSTKKSISAREAKTTSFHSK